MSTRVGNLPNGKIKEEVERILTLNLAIKYLVTSLSTEIIRAYVEEILVHCDNIDRIRKEAEDGG